MSRDFFAVHAKLMRSRRWRGLDDSQRVTLLTVWGLACEAEPEATWPHHEALMDALDIYDRPATDVVHLVEHGWLEVADDGTYTVHDWDEWQVAASTVAKNRFEAHRMRKWRRERRRNQGEPAEPDTPDRTNAYARVRTDAPEEKRGEEIEKRGKHSAKR